MGWAEQLPSGKWRAQWRDAAGKQHSKAGFTQKAAAVRFAGEQESRTRAGKQGYEGRTVTWGAWCEAWLKLRTVERTTAESDGYRIDAWIAPKWGAVPLARISTEDVQGWVNELAEQMAPASVAKVYGLFASSLRAAVRFKRLGASPCRDIDMPTVPPSDERFLTRSEVDTVLHLLDPPYRQAAVILFGTGMRFGEMAGLHRSRIDWERMAIDVVETWDGEGIKAYPKGRRKRRVPMPTWVADAVLELPEGSRGCGLPHAMGSRCTSDLVVRGPQGAPLNARNMLRRHWMPALQRAGLDHARQHDARHTYASWLAQAGRSMTEIAEVLGHSETAVTSRYAHLGATHMDAVRQVLEGV